MPIVTTAASSGEISRETTVCSASTMRAAATIGSAVSCGAAPCPPRPSTSIAKSSTAAMSAPRLTPILPTGSGLQRWRPNAAPTPSSTPSSAHACAPPWPSSAGWKRKRIGAPGFGAASRAATASADRDVPVVSARVHAAGDRRGVGLRARLLERQRVHVGAQQDAGAAPPSSATTPVFPTPARGERPIAASRSATMPAVRCSSKASSGCRCRSRRVATRVSNSAAGNSARRRSSGMGRDYRESSDRIAAMTPLVAPALDQYIRDLVPPRDPVLAEMEAYAAEHDVPIVGPGGRDPCSRSWRARSAPTAIFEMGSAIGYSTAFFARAVGRGGQVFYTDGDPANAERARAVPGPHGLCRARDDQGRRRGDVARADDGLLRRHLHRRGQGRLSGAR